MPAASKSVTFPALSVSERLLILTIAVTQFLVGHGRIWQQKRFDWDRSILWSYASVPVLVGLALLMRRRLRPLPWFLHSLELVGAKFAITATVLIALLLASGEGVKDLPRRILPSGPAVATAGKAPPPRVATVIDPATTGTLEGQVVGPDGAPVADALVYLSGGLDRWVFAAPENPVELRNDGKGFSPEVVVAQQGQPVVARSTDRVLHTVLVIQRGKPWGANVPLPGTGAEATLPLRDLRGLVALRCAVHGGSESEGHLILLTHPFHVRAGKDGRFALNGVPATAVQLNAFDPHAGEATTSITLAAGQRLDVELRFARPSP